MGRNPVQFCVLLIAIGIACQPAHAGGRKPAGRVQETNEEIFVVRKAHTVSLQYEMLGASTAKPFVTRSPASPYQRSHKDGEKENEGTSPGEHKPVTLFHFDSKFGDVAIQPVIGHVNGAQFSLGF